MADKFERIFEYRVLLAKARELHIPLTHEEGASMARLEELLPSSVPSLDDRDPYTSLAEPLAADVVYAGRFDAASIRNVSAGGLALAMNAAPLLGQHVLVHVRDSRYAFQYTLPGRVVSRVLKGQCGISVAFEGMPSRTGSLGHGSGVYRADDTPTRVGRRRTGSSV